ncbi:MAG: hypothetical protein KTR31_38640 [Myxococcales bacterium]|nr:hypothetical protein [Myxococcales bacterium]
MWADSRGIVVSRGGPLPFVFDEHGLLWYVDTETAQALPGGSAHLAFSAPACFGDAYIQYPSPRHPLQLYAEPGFFVRPDHMQQVSVCAFSFRTDYAGRAGTCRDTDVCTDIEGVPLEDMTHMPELAPPQLLFRGPLHPEP